MTSFNVKCNIRDVEVLVEALNNLKLHRNHTHYEKLAQLVNELKDITENRPIPHNVFFDEEQRIAFERGNLPECVINGERIFARTSKGLYKCAAMRLNQRLEKYLFSIQVQMGRSQRVTVEWEGRAAISTFVHWAIRLTEFGLLKRVRQCPECGRWFAAVRKTKRFCSAGCIKLVWQASDAGKEKRRVYMRKYMQKYREQST